MLPVAMRSGRMLDRNAILDRVDMVALVESYGVKLRNVGGKFIGLCPFHKDQNASLSVWPEDKRFWCFSENEGGTAIDFVMKSENVDFRYALSRLDEMF